MPRACWWTAVKAMRAGKRPAKPPAFVAALGVTLGDESLEPGYRAQFMFLPSESDLARVIGRDVDPLAIHKARKDLRKAIGTHAARRAGRHLPRHEVKGPYSPAPEAAGKRALRNAALGYLACRGQAEDIARVAAHFANARNATDEVSALAMLSELRSPERAKAFERFYERWKGDHLVIDNWFAYQAASPLPSALATVREAHPASAVLDQEPQQGAGADRHLRHGQPGELQPPGRQGLRVPRRPRAGDRCLQPADRGAAALGLPQLEGAGAGAAARWPRRRCSASPRPSRCRTTCIEIVGKMLE